MDDHEDPSAAPAGATPTWSEAQRRQSVPLRTKAAVVVVLCVLVVGEWVWSNRQQPPALGDRGAVVAEVHIGCRYLRIVDGDLTMFALEDDLPPAWRGSEVPGRLVITEHLPEDRAADDTVAGVFVADDGTEIPVIGGTGTVFEPAGCAVWGA